MDNKFPEGVILTSDFILNKILDVLRPAVVLKENEQNKTKQNPRNMQYSHIFIIFLKVLIGIVRLCRNVLL